MVSVARKQNVVVKNKMPGGEATGTIFVCLLTLPGACCWIKNLAAQCTGNSKKLAECGALHSPEEILQRQASFFSYENRSRYVAIRVMTAQHTGYRYNCFYNKMSVDTSGELVAQNGRVVVPTVVASIRTRKMLCLRNPSIRAFWTGLHTSVL